MAAAVGAFLVAVGAAAVDEAAADEEEEDGAAGRVGRRPVVAAVGVAAARAGT